MPARAGARTPSRCCCLDPAVWVRAPLGLRWPAMAWLLRRDSALNCFKVVCSVLFAAAARKPCLATFLSVQSVIGNLGHGAGGRACAGLAGLAGPRLGEVAPAHSGGGGSFSVRFCVSACCATVAQVRFASATSSDWPTGLVCSRRRAQTAQGAQGAGRRAWDPWDLGRFSRGRCETLSVI